MKNNMAGDSRLRYFLKNNQIGMALVISALLFIITIVLNPKSLNTIAIGSILSLTSMLLIASAGQTLVIISDGIDMSVGATMSMTALVTVSIMHGSDSVGLMFAAMAACIVIGAVIGLCNGIGSVKAGLPPMVVTLYISNIVSRLQYVFPSIVLFAAVFFVVMFYLLSRTRYGQQLTLTGNNNRAAYLTGINTSRIKTLNYTIAGMLGGLAGFIGAGNSGYIKCGTYDSMTMDSIVAVVIGGTLMTGGKGSYTGTAAGALLLIVLSNGLAVLQVTDSVKNMIMGIVLIVLLAAYNRAKPVRQ